MEEYIKATLFTSREVGDGEVWLSSVLPQRQIVGGNSWLAPIGQKQQQRRHRQRDKRAWQGRAASRFQLLCSLSLNASCENKRTASYLIRKITIFTSKKPQGEIVVIDHSAGLP